MNVQRTSPGKNTEGLPKAKYELVRADGEISPMKFDTAAQAVEAAGYLWPDQEQDPERTGAGWDIQVAGCER